MANAIEAALARADEQQRIRNEQVIAEARRNIQLVSDRTPEQVATEQSKIIEEARQNIPIETMQHVDEISSPLPTPNDKANYTSKVVSLNPDMHAKIESIEQGGGNNYLNENAVDRAVARQAQLSQEQAQYDREKQERERQDEQAMER